MRYAWREHSTAAGAASATRSFAGRHAETQVLLGGEYGRDDGIHMSPEVRF